MNVVCRIMGCGKPAGLPGTARGLCRPHYKRWYRYGDPLELSRRQYTYEKAQCPVEWCEEPIKSHGLCNRHYMRQLRTGMTELSVRTPRLPRICDEEECSQPVHGRNLCLSHYGAKYRPNRWNQAVDTPEMQRLRAKRRRAIAKGADGDHTLVEWQTKLACYGGRCAYCGAVADTKDHVVPLSKGGAHSIDNIVPACRSCNSRKGANTRWPFPHHDEEPCPEEAMSTARSLPWVDAAKSLIP